MLNLIYGLFLMLSTNNPPNKAPYTMLIHGEEVMKQCPFLHPIK
jgi:hypothetical protein